MGAKYVRGIGIQIGCCVHSTRTHWLVTTFGFALDIFVLLASSIHSEFFQQNAPNCEKLHSFRVYIRFSRPFREHSTPSAMPPLFTRQNVCVVRMLLH